MFYKELNNFHSILTSLKEVVKLLGECRKLKSVPTPKMVSKISCLSDNMSDFFNFIEYLETILKNPAVEAVIRHIEESEKKFNELKDKVDSMFCDVERLKYPDYIL